MRNKNINGKSSVNLSAVDLGIKSYGTRVLQEMGLSSFVKDVERNGLSFITVNNRPRCMVIPLSLVGLKKSYEQVLLSLGNVDEEDEMVLSLKNVLEGLHFHIEMALHDEELVREKSIKKNKKIIE
jgi:hypothetical protein